MAGRRVPHPRQLLTVGPHNDSHWPALRVVVSVVVPLIAVTVLGRPGLALFAVFGSFAAIYGRGEPHRARRRTQSQVGAVLVVCVGLGAAVSATGAARPWLATGVAALVAAAGSVTSEARRWRPPGPLFFVFAFGAVAAIPAATGRPGRYVVTAVAVAAAAALFSVLVGSVGALDPRRRRREPTPAPGLRTALRRPGVWRHASRYLTAALVAGTLANLSGLGHPYWAVLSAVVPMAGADTNARLLRAVQRLLGTALGLLVAAPLLALQPTGWLLIALVGATQFGAELFVLRNYSLALVFITPLALLASSFGGHVDPSRLLLDRALETALGVAVGIGATLLWSERERPDF